MGKFIFLFVALILLTILCLIGIFVAIFVDKSKVAGILMAVMSLLGALVSWGNMKLDSPQILPLNSEIVREEPEVITIIPEKGWIDIYYTLDGTDPKGGKKYEEPILLAETTTVATRGRFLFWWSDPVKEAYTFADTGMVAPEHSSDENETSSDLEGIADADADAEPSEAVVESGSVYADDYLIKWSNSTLEKLVKNYLQKDNIYYSDIKDVTEIIILGNDFVFFDDNEIVYENYDINNNEILAITRYSGLSSNKFEWKDIDNTESTYPYGYIDDLSDLKFFTSLKHLTINYQCRINLKELQNLNIRSLSINSCNINYDGFIDIINTGNIRSLSISCNNLSDFDLHKLKEMKNLNTLYLIDCNINDISFIEDLINLTKLGLQNNEFSNIDSLSNLINLEELRLDGNDIKDISVLYNLKKLKLFSGFNTKIIDWEPVSHVETVQKYAPSY